MGRAGDGRGAGRCRSCAGGAGGAGDGARRGLRHGGERGSGRTLQLEEERRLVLLLGGDARGDDARRRGGCGLRGLVGHLLGRRTQRGGAEHAQHGLLRPLPRGLAAGGLQDRVAFGQVLDGAHEDGGEGLEHSLAAHRHRGDAVHLAHVHGAVHELDVHHLGQVALVVLEDEGHGRGVEAVGEQVLGHLPEALQVLFPAIDRGVGHEDQAVRVLQDQAPGGGVHGLPGHGQDLQAEVEAAKPALRRGSRSKRMVRSCAELMEIISPRRACSACWCRTWRLVVLPPTGGP